MSNSQVKALAEMVFISEIVTQSKIAERAAERLVATTDHFDEFEVWCSIQSILYAAANISKIPWPRKVSAESGKKLRILLGVDDNNPLSNHNIRIILHTTMRELKNGSRIPMDECVLQFLILGLVLLGRLYGQK